MVKDILTWTAIGTLIVALSFTYGAAIGAMKQAVHERQSCPLQMKFDIPFKGTLA